MQLTKEFISDLILINDKAVGRALILLRNRQTDDEKSDNMVKYNNGRGFKPCHANIGVSMANFYEKHGLLTDKQLSFWRKEGKQGIRLAVYWKQLKEEAETKAYNASLSH